MTTPTKEQKENNSFKEISESLNNAAKNINNYLVAPLQNLGLGGFLFDKVVSSNCSQNASYSKHYVESGAFITDHVIYEPKRITLKGLVGERVYKSESSNNLISKLTQKLTVITAAVPKLTTGMQKIKDAAGEAQTADIKDTINSGVDFWNTLRDLIPSDRASGKAYSYLLALYETSTVMSITEPDGTYHSNMVITSIEKTTRENTFDIVDFSITLQEYRVATTEFKEAENSNFVGRAAEENSLPTNQNKETGEETTVSSTSLS